MDTSIIVGLIAGAVSFLGLVISKEQKVSDFRQAWINTVRTDLAEMLAQLSAVEYQKAGNTSAGVGDPKTKILLLSHRIQLHLNPDDSEGVISVLSEIQYLLSSNGINRSISTQLSELRDELNTNSHTLLKVEWERVKKGERWFRYSKWGLIILPVVFLVAFQLFDLSKIQVELSGAEKIQVEILQATRDK